MSRVVRNDGLVHMRIVKCGHNVCSQVTQIRTVTQIRMRGYLL